MTFGPLPSIKSRRDCVCAGNGAVVAVRADVERQTLRWSIELALRGAEPMLS